MIARNTGTAAARAARIRVDENGVQIAMKTAAGISRSTVAAASREPKVSSERNLEADFSALRVNM
jgi:hypothetical protein